MKKVIYLRVSTEDQLEGHSIEVQLKSILKTFNLDINDCEVIKDEGMSAKNDNRQGYQKILTMLESGESIDLYASTLDRLNRNTTNSDYLIYQLIATTKSRLHLVTGQNDFESSTGVLMNKVQSALAEFESKQVSERTTKIMKQMREDGKWTCGRLPIGVSLDKEKKPYYNEESIIVKKIFDMYFNDVYIHDMITQLEKNYPDYKWDVNKIKRILTNTIYGGYVVIKGESFKLIDQPLVNPEDIPKDIITNCKKEKFFVKNKRTKNKYKLKGKVFIDGNKSLIRTNPDKKNPEEVVCWHYKQGSFFSEEKIISVLEDKLKLETKDVTINEVVHNIEIDNYQEAIKLIQDLRIKSALNQTLDLRRLKRIEIDSKTRKAEVYYDNLEFNIDLSK